MPSTRVLLSAVSTIFCCSPCSLMSAASTASCSFDRRGKRAAVGWIFSSAMRHLFAEKRLGQRAPVTRLDILATSLANLRMLIREIGIDLLCPAFELLTLERHAPAQHRHCARIERVLGVIRLWIGGKPYPFFAQSSVRHYCSPFSITSTGMRRTPSARKLASTSRR